MTARLESLAARHDRPARCTAAHRRCTRTGPPDCVNRATQITGNATRQAIEWHTSALPWLQLSAPPMGGSMHAAGLQNIHVVVARQLRSLFRTCSQLGRRGARGSSVAQHSSCAEVRRTVRTCSQAQLLDAPPWLELRVHVSFRGRAAWAFSGVRVKTAVL